MKYVVLAIFIRALCSGMEILLKAALNQGINAHVFVFYRQLSAAVFMLPFSYFSERGRTPAMSFKLCFKIFMHAFIGITMTLTLYTMALNYTTAYTASAANNSMPVCTFIVAIIYGVEIVMYKRSSGIAKLVGVALFVIGTGTIAFYRGPHINPLTHYHPLGNRTSTHRDQQQQQHRRPTSSTTHSNNNPALGAFFVIASNVCWSLWMVTQRGLLKEYPSKLMFSGLQCFFSAISSFLLALPFERDFSKWKLGFDLGLISILYCGIVITGGTFYLQSWLIEKKGAVFMASFTPLTLLITIICSSFILGDVINIGSLIGGAFMIGGLYSVLWGKSKEHKDNKELLPTATTTQHGKLSNNEKEMDAKTNIGVAS